MTETTKKKVTNEALEEALKVVKNNLPGVATADKAGLVKPGSGLNVDSEGVVSVDNANIDSRAQAKVDALKLKTINGQSIKGDGDIAIDLKLFKIVESLPTADIDDTKIYLVRNTENVPDGEQNVYTEYIHTAAGWEKFGEYKTAIDLTPYAKAENVYTKEEMDAIVKEAQNQLAEQAESLQTLTTIVRSEVDGLVPQVKEIKTDLTQKGEAITALQTATSDAEMKKKYPNLAADLTQKADKTYVDQNFVKASELEALCMTAADGKALAEKVFA